MTSKTPQQDSPDDDDAWFRDGIATNTREDRIAEAVALIALLFSLGIGLVIALLPVSASAATPAPSPSLELPAQPATGLARSVAWTSTGSVCSDGTSPVVFTVTAA